MKMLDRYRYEDKLVILTLYENIEYKIDYLITEQARSSTTQRPMRFFEHLRIFWLFQNYQCGFYLIINKNNVLLPQAKETLANFGHAV